MINIKMYYYETICLNKKVINGCCDDFCHSFISKCKET